MKVLIVDGYDTAADLLAELLSDAYTVRTTYSASQALTALEEEAFEVALVDFNLPDLPGTALAAQLRDLSTGLVLVAITASSLHDVHASKDSKLFAHVLQKPIQFEDLAAILTKLVREQEAAAGPKIPVGTEHPERLASGITSRSADELGPPGG